MTIKSVLVVGGGIAGLAVTSALNRSGIRCVVAEKAAVWRPAGAGIILNVNAMAALRMLGVADGVRRAGFRLGKGAITDHRGRALARTDFGALDADFGPTLAIHRAKLHTALLAGTSDAEILLDTSVDQMTIDTAGVDVRLTDGRRERFDLVIGADGIDSRVRSLAFTDAGTEYAGYTCWRFVVEAQLEHDAMWEMWGCGKRFGVVPIGKSRFYAFAVANAARGTPDPGPGRLERFRERFAEFCGPVPTLLAALGDSDELLHNDLCAVPAGNWFNGRVVLIGDAAHAMTPNMGQGAGMALEDAAVLIDLLLTGIPTAEALEQYRVRREGRVRWVQNQSRRIGRIGQLENPVACRLRNIVLGAVPDSVGLSALRKLVEQPI